MLLCETQEISTLSLVLDSCQMVDQTLVLNLTLVKEAKDFYRYFYRNLNEQIK